MRKTPRRKRAFGRQYVIQWDADVRRYHVSLGDESIGFHKTQGGAAEIAKTHAQCVALPGAPQEQAFAIETIEE